MNTVLILFIVLVSMFVLIGIVLFYKEMTDKRKISDKGLVKFMHMKADKNRWDVPIMDQQGKKYPSHPAFV